MNKSKDFLWNGDLVTANGDFVIGLSDKQHIQDIVESTLGSWKQYPSVGVGALQYINSRDFGGLQANIINQLNQDGYTVNVQANILDTGQYQVYGERADENI